MRFADLLTADIDLPPLLFHGTSIPRLLKILRANALRPGNLRSGPKNCISTSRKMKVAAKIGADDPEFPKYGAVLVLDTAKLRTRYKLADYDDIGDGSEFEVVISGTVKPILPMLAGILVPGLGRALLDADFLDYLAEFDGIGTEDAARAALEALRQNPLVRSA